MDRNIFAMSLLLVVRKCVTKSFRVRADNGALPLAVPRTAAARLTDLRARSIAAWITRFRASVQWVSWFTGLTDCPWKPNSKMGSLSAR